MIRRSALKHEDGRHRCPWCGTDALYVAYHDTEWGVPERNDRALYEKLVLDGFQAGLSWITILRKREAFRRAFEGFDPEIIARFDEAKIEALMSDTGIVRNRAKILGAIAGARAYLEIMGEPGGFRDYLWQFVDSRPIVNRWRSMSEVPAETAEARAMSKALKARGFKFVGPTICYAFMQATGMVDDHTQPCFRAGGG